jgi:hypothetical protein
VRDWEVSNDWYDLPEVIWITFKKNEKGFDLVSVEPVEQTEAAGA